MIWIKGFSLFAFAIGIATIMKNCDFADWIETSPSIAVLMMFFGAIGILICWGDNS